ncbi:MAG TPA: ClbS/DfsB family four-helix bundle protein [Thermoflexales bacterium]|nr:ClbS/DfsB family four-helix bundle protein [Thermoflexales bacterium]HQW36088.1 ClbS/DfsB family four-helix bundle protein [Thermoflexales bacterium]HQX75142.1 ClbS/DfsB family four-helix bundle protein [Thermoflexales bacterium]
MKHTTKAALLADIETTHAALEATLARVPSSQMSAPGVTGEWSVKDILAHIAMWRSRAITQMFKAEQGQPPKMEIPATLAKAANWLDLFNAQEYAAQKDRPLDRVMADFGGSHRQLVKRLRAWGDEAALFDPKRYPALNGRSLAETIWSDSAEHEAEHRAEIEAWLSAAPV